MTLFKRFLPLSILAIFAGLTVGCRTVGGCGPTEDPTMRTAQNMTGARGVPSAQNSQVFFKGARLTAGLEVGGESMGGLAIDLPAVDRILGNAMGVATRTVIAPVEAVEQNVTARPPTSHAAERAAVYGVRGTCDYGTAPALAPSGDTRSFVNPDATFSDGKPMWKTVAP